MSALPGKRGLRWLLLVSASLSAIAVFLLATATANTALFAQGYDTLLIMNGVLVALLMLVVGWQLWQLRRKLKAGIFGSRLAVRLVFLFALVAVLPGALVYAVSVQFIGRSIESWFDVRVDRALEGGLNLGRNALDYLLQETTNKASQMAVTLADSRGNLAGVLNRSAEQANVYEAVLFSPTGSVLAVAGVGGSRATPEPPPAQALRLARLQQPYAKTEQTPEGGLRSRVVVPVNTEDSLNPLKLLQVIEPVPKPLAQDADRVQAGVRDYQELTFSRGALKRLYALTLTLTLLLALTSALGLAVVLSERFAAPLGLLAEGTRAVAQGDFTRRQPVVSRDELGVLTESFNTMTEQLAEAQGKAEDSRRATETTRAYLESILGNLSAGVLVFDERHRLRTVNPSAAVILQQPLAELTGLSLADWGKRLPALSSFAELVSEGFRGSREGQWQKEAELAVANLSRTLLMRGTRLPGTTTTGGYVVVFDDVSELVQAQRDAAWAEVARRLAHEIKNPLTPIQLSAERLAMKLTPKLEGPDQETLRRGTQTIVSQVGAMKHMVDDFAIYARQPRPGQMQHVDLTGLLLDVLALYDNLGPHVALSLPDTPLVIQGEPTRLRQVFHNLISNAVDAQADVPDPHFAISLAGSGGEATLAFADGGPGFADDVLTHAFEPYVTTKAKGTGLGLAIVKKIVDEHGGRVVLANGPDGGARVTLVFPFHATGSKPAAVAAEAGTTMALAREILIVDDEVGIRELLSEILQDEGYRVALAENASEARAYRQRLQPSLVLLDIWMPDTDGVTLLREWAAGGQLTMPVVMMSGHGTIETAVDATKIGAFDFLEKPVGLQKLLSTIARALKSAAAQEPRRISLSLLGAGTAVRETERALEHLLAGRRPLLIVGEPGTGHDIAARALQTPDVPWIALPNGARLTANPLALIEEARDGVLYFAEVGQYSKAEQRGLAFLLPKLDKHNVTLVCTSTEALGNLASEGKFDPALLAQLSSGVVMLPPLRKRREDIPLLIERYWREVTKDDGPAPLLGSLPPAALTALTNAYWPGNLDHLSGFIQNLVLLRGEITTEHVKRVLGEAASPNPSLAPEITSRFFELPLREAREAFERIYFEQLLGKEQSNMSKVAEKAGLERTHLYRKLKQLNIRFSRRTDDSAA